MRQGFREGLVENLNVQLKVEPQAAGIDIGGPDMHVVIVDNNQFGVRKGRGLIVHLHAALQELPQQVARRPVHDMRIAFPRKNDRYAKAVATKEVKIRHIGNCMKADPAYGKGVAKAIGIPLKEIPKK